jgi:hypothetical protein
LKIDAISAATSFLGRGKESRRNWRTGPHFLKKRFWFFSDLALTIDTLVLLPYYFVFCTNIRSFWTSKAIFSDSRAMCNSCDYSLVLSTLVSLYTERLELALRQKRSCLTGVVTDSRSSVIVNFTSDYVFFEYILSLTASISGDHCFLTAAFCWHFKITFLPMLVLPYETTMSGKTPTYVGPSGPMPMQDLTGNSQKLGYTDPTTNSERLPPRPRDRSALEKTYARWCCGSILGVIAWISMVFLLVTVPIVVVALKNMVSP